MSKLTVEQVEDIKQMLADRISLNHIGRLFGVTRQTIWKIAHQKTWVHARRTA